MEDSDTRIIDLNNRRDILTSKAEEIKQRLKNLFSNQEQLRIKTESKESEFIKTGGSLGSLRSELTSKKALLKNKINAIHEELLDYASGELPLMLVSHLLQDIKLSSNVEQEYKIKKLASKSVDTPFFDNIHKHKKYYFFYLSKETKNDKWVIFDWGY